ncbi:DUF916 and DUF3324 domain-containing protein [Enterococcus sp. OL5]|uniref:DUF916 and DUF3324 domain-containing protein n=1 Tax=Enterococcus sp. OL5 TaxID=2590214 RepID=UPI0011299284|nr:DUF916 and DUF3324 domain-containing protein [Enterococcus sp. OL5]TPR55157.1 DUF916 and DUF3324 domain-containing protein [Enterococcus sp. OL5]
MKTIKEQKKHTVPLVLLMVILCFGFFHQTGYADDVNNFSIQTFDEEGNVNAQGYYHFIGQPGEKREISIKVYNATDETITVKAAVNPASTNENGIPSYLKEEKYDSSLTHRMDQLVKIEEAQRTIPASGSVTLKAVVSFPEEDWTGDILGGIRFTEEVKNTSEQTVVHEVAYTVGVLLNQKDGAAVENDLQLKGITAGQRNYRNFIEANIQNSAAAIVRNMSVESSVVEKRSNATIYTYDAYDLRMAPNSNFNFGIPTGDRPVKAGDYVLKMKVTADGKTYQFEENFTIDASEARQLNQSAVNIDEGTPYLLYLTLGGAGLLVLLTLGRWLGMNRKKGELL